MHICTPPWLTTFQVAEPLNSSTSNYSAVPTLKQNFNLVKLPTQLGSKLLHGFLSGLFFFSFLGPLLAAFEAELHHSPLLAGIFSFMFCEIIMVTPSSHVLGPPKA